MEPGILLTPRFKIDRQVSAGGMGVVYRADDLEGHEPVAIKLLKPGAADRRRFGREARGLARLQHPRIVRYVADGITDADEPYLVMEWLDGEDLASRLDREPLSVEETLTIMRGVCEGLALAHQEGIVHRDLKPSNLFLVGGDPARVKIVDFGIARFTQYMMTVTESGMMLGTPGYMAPEQARGDPTVDARADVFSLGCVFYECLTGLPAFASGHPWAVLTKILFEEAPRVRAVRPEISWQWDALIARMLAKQPEDRPRDAVEVLAELASSTGEARLSRPAASRPSLTATERRVVSVMLAKFLSSMSANVGSQDEVSTVASRDITLEPLRALAAQYGGQLEQLADSTLVAVFSSSGIASDMATQAARCTLRVRALLGDMPIALATGRTVVLGKQLPAEVIERAAKVLQSNLGGSEEARFAIHIDDVTAGLIDQRFELEREANGHRLLSERDQPDAARRLLGKPVRCIGRNRELAMLEAIYSQCVTDSTATAVLVTGAAGVGKSRLRYELLRRLDQSGTPPQTWFGRGDPMRAGSPFALLAHALRGAFGLIDGESLDVRRAKILERVARSVHEDTHRVAEFLGELCSTPFADEGRVQLRAARQDPILMGDQMRRAWEDWLSGELRTGPVVMVIEDLQWGDLPSVKCIDAALRNLAEAPLFVFALARNEVHEAFPSLWQERALQIIPLRELTKRACADLVREALGDGISEDQSRRIVDQSAGNAFYLEELIRAIAEGRSATLPDTVLAMLESRLSTLSPEARRVLRAASIYGEVFWEQAVETLLSSTVAPETLHPLLASLADAEWILRRHQARFHNQTEFVFRHALVREAAYVGLIDADRELGHHLAAEWLEQAGETDAMILAEHFLRAAEPGRAAQSYKQAAQQALEGDDLGATLARVDRAVECGASGGLLGSLRLLEAEAHNWRGSFANGETAASEALKLLVVGSSEWVRAIHLLSWAHWSFGNRERVERLSHELESAFELVGPNGANVVALAWAGAHLVDVGALERAAEIFNLLKSRAGLVLEQIPSAAAALASARGIYEIAAGQSESALTSMEAALEALEQAGDRRNECLVRVNLGSNLIELGNYSRATAVLERAADLALRMGLEHLGLVADFNLLTAHVRNGDLKDAIRLFRNLADKARACNDRQAEIYGRIELAGLLRLSGELVEGVRETERAKELSEGVPLLEAYSLAARARIYLDQGNLDDATAAASSANELCETAQSFGAEDTFVRLTYAEVLDAAGERAGSRAALSTARERMRIRAEKIENPSLRASFLENVAENSKIVSLAREWSLSAGE